MRRISPGTITVGVIAIMIGLVVAYVVRRSLDAPPQSDSPAGVAVVVATVNLAEGQVVQANFVEVARLPAERVPQGAIRIPAVATGRLVKSTIRAGSTITEPMLHEIGANLRVPLSQQVPKGYRAMVVQATGVLSSGGFIRAGSLVDISITVEGQHPDLGSDSIKRIGTRTLMRSVQVLGLDRNTGRTSATGLVVAVTPDQAKRLILAQSIGTLTVSLIGEKEGPISSADDAQDSLVNPDELFEFTFPEPTEEIVTEPPKPVTVEVFRSDRREVLTFTEDQVREAVERGADGESMPIGFLNDPEKEEAEKDPAHAEPENTTSVDARRDRPEPDSADPPGSFIIRHSRAASIQVIESVEEELETNNQDPLTATPSIDKPQLEIEVQTARDMPAPDVTLYRPNNLDDRDIVKAIQRHHFSAQRPVSLMGKAAHSVIQIRERQRAEAADEL